MKIEHWDGSTWSLELLTFLSNHALPRELGALDGPVLRDVSFEGLAIIRAGKVDTPIAAAHTR